MNRENYKVGDILYQYKSIDSLKKFKIVSIYETLIILGDLEYRNLVHCRPKDLHKYYFKTEELAKNNLIETYSKTIISLQESINNLQNKVDSYKEKLDKLKGI